MFIIAAWFPNKPVEIIIDRVNKYGSMIDKANEYAKTDVWFKGDIDYIQPIPLAKGLTFREIVPIQAADFLAWEIRKLIDSRDEWYNKFKTGDDPALWNKSVNEWSKQRKKIPRKSYEILSDKTKPYGFVWDYHELCWLDVARQFIWS
jgi:hypothetical protein